MPIRPENKARYPADWPVIAAAVRRAAGDCCEGSPDYPDCRVPNGAVGYRERGRWVQLGTCAEDAGLAVDAAVEDGHKVLRIVLTVHCDRANLRAWCQRCHLHYDRHHHAATAYATRKALACTVDMFEKEEPQHEAGAANRAVGDAARTVPGRKERRLAPGADGSRAVPDGNTTTAP